MLILLLFITKFEFINFLVDSVDTCTIRKIERINSFFIIFKLFFDKLNKELKVYLNRLLLVHQMSF